MVLNTTPARADFPDCLAKTARKSAASRKPTAPKRSSTQAKPDEKTQGSAEPIIVTESEDAPAPPRAKQSQRKSAVPQLKPTDGSAKGNGKAKGLQRDDPIDLEPPDGVSDVSDVEMSIPAPRPRSSPNESYPASAKEETLQRNLLQASPPAAEYNHSQVVYPSSYRVRRPTNRYGNKLTSYSRYKRINNKRWKAGRRDRRPAMGVRQSIALYDGASCVPPAYKYYRQAVEESRKLATSLDADSSPLLPREIVEEERKVTNQGIEQLKQEIRIKVEQLHKAETRIRELQESGLPPYLSCVCFLKLSQKRCCVVISRLRSNAAKL